MKRGPERGAIFLFFIRKRERQTALSKKEDAAVNTRQKRGLVLWGESVPPGEGRNALGGYARGEVDWGKERTRSRSYSWRQLAPMRRQERGGSSCNPERGGGAEDLCEEFVKVREKASYRGRCVGRASAAICHQKRGDTSILGS